MTPAILITIPLSHYCEKARWALDRVGLPYREDAYVPIIHRLVTGRHLGTTVPVLVHEGRHYNDSTDILKYADQVTGGDRLYPRDPALRAEVEALEDRFDEELGPQVRRWGYDQMLPDAALVRKVWERKVPASQTRWLPLIVPIGRPLVKFAYRITPEKAARSLERTRAAFREVDALLADGRRYLVGGRLTAADITFASLAGPAVLPPESRAAHPLLEEAPPAMREEIVRLRATPAGRFALRLYQEARG